MLLLDGDEKATRCLSIQNSVIRIPPQLGDSSSATGGASTKTERKSDQQQHSGKYMSHIALLGLNQGRIREEGMQLTISPTCEQKLNSIYL